jgi:hypothetical protein
MPVQQGTFNGWDIELHHPRGNPDKDDVPAAKQATDTGRTGI